MKNKKNKSEKNPNFDEKTKNNEENKSTNEKKDDSLHHHEYLKNVTLFCFAISTLLLMFWKHKFKKNTMNEFIFVCRCSIFFPMIKLVICLFILVKMIM